MALAGLSAQGAAFVYSGSFSGLNEVPANNSAGIGSALVTFDDVLLTLRVQANFSGLTGNVTNAHIHCCVGPGVNAGVATPTPTFPGFPAGVKFGTYDQTFDLALTTSFNGAFVTSNGNTAAGARAALINALNTGNAYFNIHTSSFSGGEIRANLSPVPEPSTMGLGLLALGGLIAARKRLKKA